MKQDFVVFLSPGTFVSEEVRKPIGSWDVDQAVEMSKDITVRYDATPYGFYFITKERKDDELDSKEVAQSGMYYLGGEVYSREDIVGVEGVTDIFIRNMDNNGWKMAVVNRSSWLSVWPLLDTDVVLEMEK